MVRFGEIQIFSVKWVNFKKCIVWYSRRLQLILRKKENEPTLILYVWGTKHWKCRKFLLLLGHDIVFEPLFSNSMDCILKIERRCHFHDKQVFSLTTMLHGMRSYQIWHNLLTMVFLHELLHEQGWGVPAITLSRSS